MNTPKFKEGEWIKRKEDGSTAQVVMLLNTCYSLRFADDYSWCLDYAYQDNWEIISNPNEESGSSEISNDLQSACDYANFEESHSLNAYIAFEEGFKKGAKWDRSQMMKEAVEVRVQTSPLNGPLGISAYCCNFPSKHPFYHCKEGDKVKIIIIKEEGKHV